MLTFQEFQATRSDVADLRDTPYLDGTGPHHQPGYLYLGSLAIERQADWWTMPEEFHLVIGNQSIASDNLGDLERQLYRYACDEGLCGEEPEANEPPGWHDLEAEVERLRAVNAQLLAALKVAELWVRDAEGDAEYPAVQRGAMTKVRAAIEAAEAGE